MVVWYAKNLSYMLKCKMTSSQKLVVTVGRKCGQYFYFNNEFGVNFKLLSSFTDLFSCYSGGITSVIATELMDYYGK